MAPLAESRGVVRDTLAAVRNLEHLLRSPRVGPRALLQVIPSLQELCDPVVSAVDMMLGHVRSSADLPVAAACTELHTFVGSVTERVRSALTRASAGPMDAKSRLAFEAAIMRSGAELNSVRQLVDLLVRATERSDTDLYIDDLVRAMFSSEPQSSVQPRAATVVAAFRGESTPFVGSPQVVFDLWAHSIALVYGDSKQPVYLTAESRPDAALLVRVSRDEAHDGEAYSFEPPLLIPPTLECARTAAALVSARFESDGDRVVISWPNA